MTIEIFKSAIAFLHINTPYLTITRQSETTAYQSIAHLDRNTAISPFLGPTLDPFNIAKLAGILFLSIHYDSLNTSIHGVVKKLYLAPLTVTGFATASRTY
ncbi:MULTISPECIES: hypothetical protein [unclassified Microcoleus]|uniref:hypothetical protein n=1 Tax=unclassified Microcoleus TaxID=2642155 RepID=UPI0025D75DD6|nr:MULTISPECIES: hypothetical protein [unclassified Microcoleus]